MTLFKQKAFKQQALTQKKPNQKSLAQQSSFAIFIAVLTTLTLLKLASPTHNLSSLHHLPSASITIFLAVFTGVLV